jgi:hypothetical protein
VVWPGDHGSCAGLYTDRCPPVAVVRGWPLPKQKPLNAPRSTAAILQSVQPRPPRPSPSRPHRENCRTTQRRGMRQRQRSAGPEDARSPSRIHRRLARGAAADPPRRCQNRVERDLFPARALDRYRAPRLLRSRSAGVILPRGRRGARFLGGARILPRRQDPVQIAFPTVSSILTISCM